MVTLQGARIKLKNKFGYVLKRRLYDEKHNLLETGGGFADAACRCSRM
jgi:hypothetical protein